jgi:hypothetical protein
MEAEEEMNMDSHDDDAAFESKTVHGDTDSVSSDLPLHAEQWTEDDYQYDREELTMMKNQLRPSTRNISGGDSSVCCCCSTTHESRSARFRKNVRRTVHLLNISPRMKALILDRYVALVEQYASTKNRFTRIYNTTRCVTTLCGILTPALVSIQPFFGSDTTQNPMYWTTFSTSFTLALINGYISLYKVDKKYASSTKAYLDLESAGWEYFSLVGRYAAQDPTEPKPTHANRFHQFMTRVEEIRKGESKIDYGGNSSEDHGFRTTSVELRGGAATPADVGAAAAAVPSLHQQQQQQQRGRSTASDSVHPLVEEASA